MNYKRNAKYFTQKNILLPVGIGVAAAGIVMSLAGWWIYISLCIVLIGIALVIFGNESMIKGEELDRAMTGYAAEFKSRVLKNYRIDTNYTNVEILCQYEFSSPELVMRRGKDGKNRASTFSCAAVFASGETLYLIKETVSLTEDKTERGTDEFLLSSLSKLTVEERTASACKCTARYFVLVISFKDGKTAELTVPQSANAYDLADSVNNIIK